MEICSDGPQPWPQPFESIIQRYEKVLQAIGIDSSPLGKCYWDLQARKSSFSPVFLNLVVLQVFGSESAQTDHSRGPNPSNRSFRGMRRPSNQSELIAVPLGCVIGTHRPEKARFPCIFVPCRFASFWLRKCSDGPEPWPRPFESIIQGYEKALQSIGTDSSPLGQCYWDSQARKSSFSLYFCTLSFCKFLAQKVLRRTTAVAPTLRIDHSEV